MDGIDLQNVKKEYLKKNDIWPQRDKWHYYSYKTIGAFIYKNVMKLKIPIDIDIINLGSGGNPYCFEEKNMLHVDIVGKNIINKQRSLISNIEKIDVSNNSYHCCLCVGSVINYTDALRSIKEIARILKDGGYLFLEFENSKSFEFYNTNDYNKSATIVETFYQGEKEKLWVYSESFVKQILNDYKFNILDIRRFHIVSPLIYRLNKNSIKASRFSKLDNFVSHIPIISKNASNVILIAQKTLS
jgi:hypothetical protein